MSRADKDRKREAQYRKVVTAAAESFFDDCDRIGTPAAKCRLRERVENAKRMYQREGEKA